MNLPILNKIQTSNIETFISFWSKLYSYNLEDLYNSTIIKEQYSADDIQNLFVWKNGMKLSVAKQASLDKKVKAKLSLVNELKLQKELNIELFKSEFANISAVWKIFLLHVIKPLKYPIYDQHINRAFNFIHELDYSNISATSMSDKIKEKFYFNSYLPFIEKLNGIHLKKLDEAFFAFGQFINTNYNAKLFHFT